VGASSIQISLCLRVHFCHVMCKPLSHYPQWLITLPAHVHNTRVALSPVRRRGSCPCLRPGFPSNQPHAHHHCITSQAPNSNHRGGGTTAAAAAAAVSHTTTTHQYRVLHRTSTLASCSASRPTPSPFPFVLVRRRLFSPGGRRPLSSCSSPPRKRRNQDTTSRSRRSHGTIRRGRRPRRQQQGTIERG